MDHPGFSMLDQLAVGVILLDSNLLVTMANSAAESMLGISRTRVVGRPLGSIFIGPDKLNVKLRKVCDGGEPIVERVCTLRTHNSAEITVDCRISPVRGDRNNSLCVEFNPLDWLLARQRDESIQNQQSALADFLRGLAHEIKNPLGGMRGAAQLLLRTATGDARQYAEVIILEADRLNQLVDRFGQASSAETAVNGNIHRLLDRVAHLVLADTGIRLTKDYDPSIPELPLYTDMFLQSVLNLCRNAIEAEADEVVLRSRIGDGAMVNGRWQGQFVTIQIIDNGNGVPEQLGDRIFLPMISGRANGSGIGLAFTQSAIRHHDGHLDYRSKPGRTEFTLTIPIKPGTGARSGDGES